MPFGQETRVPDLGRGLDLFNDQATIPPNAALVAQNVTFDEVGAMKKRLGYTRGLQKQFTGFIGGIIPVQNCFGIQAFLIGHDGINLAVF